jgi:hypothetical protein
MGIAWLSTTEPPANVGELRRPRLMATAVMIRVKGLGRADEGVAHTRRSGTDQTVTTATGIADSVISPRCLNCGKSSLVDSCQKLGIAIFLDQSEPRLY